jgi:hypothetical protein
MLRLEAPWPSYRCTCSGPRCGHNHSAGDSNQHLQESMDTPRVDKPVWSPDRGGTSPVPGCRHNAYHQTQRCLGKSQ